MYNAELLLVWSALVQLLDFPFGNYRDTSYLCYTKAGIIQVKYGEIKEDITQVAHSYLLVRSL